MRDLIAFFRWKFISVGPVVPYEYEDDSEGWFAWETTPLAAFWDEAQRYGLLIAVQNFVNLWRVWRER